MRLILILFILFGFIDKFKGRVVLTVHLQNYKNVYNYIHNGQKCESFDFFDDHCDPMFDICITQRYSCDILKKKLSSWHNTKIIPNVLFEKIRLNYFPIHITANVRVDDHDSYDGNDHIAEFSTNFDLTSSNKYYNNFMSVNPYNYGVSLQASVIVECESPYNGEKCQYKYNEKECLDLCGQGRCSYKNWRQRFICECQDGWTGQYCKEYFVHNCALLECEQQCTYSGTIKECVCTSSRYKKHCREFIPEKIKTTSKLFVSTIYSSTIFPTTKATPKLKETTIYNSTVSTIETSTRFPSTKTSRKYVLIIATEEKKTNNPTNRSFLEKIVTKGKHVFSESVKVNSFIKKNVNLTRYESQIQPETIQKFIEDKLIKVHYPSSTIIIICLLVLLCLSILALILVIRNKQKSKIIRSEMSYQYQRPLPPVIFQRNHSLSDSFKYIVQGQGAKLRKSDDGYESCIILNNENLDTYEEPIINQMESLTCETDDNDYNLSDIYELPVRKN